MRFVPYFSGFAAALALAVGCSNGDATGDPGTGEETTPTKKPTPAPSGSSDTSSPAPSQSQPAAPASTDPVTIKVLTYNVAGLPEGISSSHPATNTPLMSPKLNPYDLVVVQEDFSYHKDLIAQATHANKSTPMTGNSLGDGLNTLSRLPFALFQRTGWTKCNGYTDQGGDCLTPKGFTRFAVDFGGGRMFDFYDVHFDAGRGAGDVAAREEQVAQLIAAIKDASTGHAVVVAGDTNMKDTDEATLQKLLTGASLEDACRKVSCPQPTLHDRVMVRSSDKVTLTVKSWALDTTFVDSSGNPLSDHDPVSVQIEAH